MWRATPTCGWAGPRAASRQERLGGREVAAVHLEGGEGVEGDDVEAGVDVAALLGERHGLAEAQLAVLELAGVEEGAGDVEDEAQAQGGVVVAEAAQLGVGDVGPGLGAGEVVEALAVQIHEADRGLAGGAVVAGDLGDAVAAQEGAGGAGVVAAGELGDAEQDQGLGEQGGVPEALGLVDDLPGELAAAVVVAGVELGPGGGEARGLGAHAGGEGGVLGGLGLLGGGEQAAGLAAGLDGREAGDGLADALDGAGVGVGEDLGDGGELAAQALAAVDLQLEGAALS